MFLRLDEVGLGAVGTGIAPGPGVPPPPEFSFGQGLTTIVGGLISAGGGFASSFITADANKQIMKEQGKTEQFSILAQQKIAIEQTRAQTEIAGIETQGAVARSQIWSQVATYGVVAVAVIGLGAAAAYVAAKS